MVKLVGSILVVGGCVGLGGWYRGQFIGRLKQLRILITILDLMISEVRYSKSSLPECCRQLSGRLPEPYGNSFFKVWEETQENSGEGYRDIFVRNLKRCMEQVPLGAEEKKLFLEVSGQFGYEEARMQINSMEQCKEQLKNICGGLEKEVGEKGRMAMGLGTLGGLLLIIVLL
ncbi:MAG: stage III sporulation protein AB [Lachnospiraceae bacterium]|nr:stage III sporulation protein AB [Lachnospiraceae bacterium]